MNDEEIREHTTSLILDHARDVEWLSINESLEDFDLTADEADRVAKQVDDLIAKATITVELPGAAAAQLGNEEYDAAIEMLIATYGSDSEPFVSLIETARDEEALHTTDNEIGGCVDDCMGCFTERLADAITRATARGDATC